MAYFSSIQDYSRPTNHPQITVSRLPVAGWNHVRTLASHLCKLTNASASYMAGSFLRKCQFYQWPYSFLFGSRVYSATIQAMRRIFQRLRRIRCADEHVNLKLQIQVISEVMPHMHPKLFGTFHCRRSHKHMLPKTCLRNCFSDQAPKCVLLCLPRRAIKFEPTRPQRLDLPIMWD